MKIANLPADHGRPRGIAPQVNLEDGLGSLRDYVALASLSVKNGSILQGMIKIKAKLTAILGAPPPAPFSQCRSIRHQDNSFLTGTLFMLTK